MVQLDALHSRSFCKTDWKSITLISLIALLALACALALVCTTEKAHAYSGTADLVAGDISLEASAPACEDASSDAGLQAQATATSWQRLSGETALDTMESIVRAGNFQVGGTVVLATVDGYWDALTSAGAAGMRTSPILMTDGRTLSSQTRGLLADLKPTKLVVCGGPAAVSESVAAEAATAAGGCELVRFYGQDAVGTSVDIFKKAPGELGTPWANMVFICTSGGYWDALAAAPISYALHIPILLTYEDGTIPDSVIEAMKGKVERFVIVGGSAAVPDSTKDRLVAAGFTFDSRLGGETAIETSEAVANYGLSKGMSADNLGVATTSGYWDALAGAALCGKRKGVMVLVSDPSSHSLNGYVRNHYGSCNNGLVFGGTAAVSEETYTTLIDNSSPATHIATPYYSFDIPDYWDGRVVCESGAGGYPQAKGINGGLSPIYSTKINHKTTGSTLYIVTCYERSKYIENVQLGDSNVDAVVYGDTYVVVVHDLFWYLLYNLNTYNGYSSTTANDISDIMTGGRIPYYGDTKYQGKNRMYVDEDYIKEALAPSIKAR